MKNIGFTGGENPPHALWFRDTSDRLLKCVCHWYSATNEMGRHWLQVRSEMCLKSLDDLTIWSAILASNQFWQTRGPHSCQSHRLPQKWAHITRLQRGLEGYVLSGEAFWRRFGVGAGRRKRIKHCGEMKRPVQGSGPQRWRYIEEVSEGRAEQPGGPRCRSRLYSPRALICALQLRFITFSRCPPKCSSEPDASASSECLCV